MEYNRTLLLSLHLYLLHRWTALECTGLNSKKSAFCINLSLGDLLFFVVFLAFSFLFLLITDGNGNGMEWEGTYLGTASERIESNGNKERVILLEPRSFLSFWLYLCVLFCLYVRYCAVF